MAEIVLSKYDAQTGQLLTLPKEKVELILKQIIPAGAKRVRLHGVWTEPVEYMDWLLDEVNRLGLRTTLTTKSLHDLKGIWDKIDGGMFIELSLQRDSEPEDYSSLNIKSNLSYFIAIDTISPDGSKYQDLLAQVTHHPCKAILGVNWQSQLTGPEPIDEEDYEGWSKTVITIVEHLSKKKITSEFACGLKLCMFSREQLGHLPSLLANWPIASCARSYFYDVDGSVKPCMRLRPSAENTFDCHSDIFDITEKFLDWLDPYCGHCMESDKFDCRSLKVGCCRTGCIAHTIDEFHSF